MMIFVVHYGALSVSVKLPLGEALSFRPMPINPIAIGEYYGLEHTKSDRNPIGC
ncbi:hypothetical protein [Saccharibacter sp. 17.LH.SD]|uniref:hypothetical protein n=1 Tax=Saccharibacter sp. 17.LH.SD TaxID=2689393 RepID=UPI00351B8ED2